VELLSGGLGAIKLVQMLAHLGQRKGQHYIFAMNTPTNMNLLVIRAAALA